MCVDVNKLTVKELEERVLKSLLNMVQPDAVKDSTGDVVISSEEGEMEGTYTKILSDMGIVDGTVLSVDDFVQNYSLQVIINHRYYPLPEREIKIVFVTIYPYLNYSWLFMITEKLNTTSQTLRLWVIKASASQRNKRIRKMVHKLYNLIEICIDLVSHGKLC